MLDPNDAANTAHELRKMFLAFKEAGFSDDQAIQLIGEFMRAGLQAGAGKDEIK